MSEYTEQAEKFLQDTGTTLIIEYQYTGPYFQGDNDKRDVFRFTLKNAKGAYSSTFADSIRNSADRANCAKGYPIRNTGERAKRAKGYKKPSAYDILACLEKYEPDTFDNWLLDTGYIGQPISDYPKVLKMWMSCVAQYRGLQKIFTDAQMEQLREIN